MFDKKNKTIQLNWKKVSIITLLTIVSIAGLFFAGLAIANYTNCLEDINSLESRNESLETELAYQGESYSDQILTLEIQTDSIQEELNKILTENTNLKTDFNDFSTRALDYINLKSRIADYESRGIDIGNSRDELASLYSLLLEEKYTEFDTKEEAVAVLLDENLKKKEAEIAAAKAAVQKSKTTTTSTTTPTNTTAKKNNRNSYSYYEQKYVETEVGNFWVDMVVADLNNPNLRIITDTVDERDNCWNTGCGAKSLGDYVSANGGFAGIHGSYFCPPDYTASCSNIPYSFDLAVYNSRINKWINPYLKFKGLMTFNGKAPKFYYGQEDSILQSISVTAGIANHPALISGGNLVYSGLDSKQANVKSYRGGIGYKDNFLYLIIARSATVPDLAYVMKALGIQNGLNLDGGGSSALYYDGYKVGPGRLLPNAIILVE